MQKGTVRHIWHKKLIEHLWHIAHMAHMAQRTPTAQKAHQTCKAHMAKKALRTPMAHIAQKAHRTRKAHVASIYVEHDQKPRITKNTSFLFIKLPPPQHIKAQ